MSTSTRHSTGLIGALNTEWSQLLAADHAELHQWRSEPGPLCAARDLDHVLDLISNSPDAALAPLITAAQVGDTLAARTVVQAFIPRVCRLVRHIPSGPVREEAVTDAVEYLWELVVTYPLANRPRKIAANLALDLFKRTRPDQASYRGDGAIDSLQHLDDNNFGSRRDALLNQSLDCSTDTPNSAAEVDELLRDAATDGYITTAEAALLRAYYSPGRNADVARRLGIRETALRRRALTAREKLRRHATELVA